MRSPGCSFRITSKPLRPGICRSRKTRSGEESRIAASAESPSAASPISATSSICSSSSRNTLRATGSSSTIGVFRAMDNKPLHASHSRSQDWPVSDCTICTNGLKSRVIGSRRCRAPRQQESFDCHMIGARYVESAFLSDGDSPLITSAMKAAVPSLANLNRLQTRIGHTPDVN